MYFKFLNLIEKIIKINKDNLLNKLISILKEIGIKNNIFIARIYLIFIIVGIISLILGIKLKTYKKIKFNKINDRFNAKKISKFLNKIVILRLPINNLSSSLSFINTYSKEVNDVIALVIYLIYLTIVFLIIKYINQFAYLWYTKALNSIIAFMLPFLILNSYTTIKRNKIINQLPQAYLEILSSYRSCRKKRQAINEAIKYMPKEIKREFIRLNGYIQSENTFEYGLDYFAERMKSKQVNLFCIIMKISHYQSSDITKQLEQLVIKTRSQNYLKEKAKRQLVWYRLFLIVWVLTIPMIMKFARKISVEAYNYYYTVEGGILLTLSILSCIIAYILIYIMEK